MTDDGRRLIVDLTDAEYDEHTITIPRAKYEALMAAAKVVADRDSDPSTWMRKRYEALAALRTAGIDLEDMA